MVTIKQERQCFGASLLLLGTLLIWMAGTAHGQNNINQNSENDVSQNGTNEAVELSDQERYIENSVNACIAVSIGTFGRCNGVITAEERQQSINFCETTQREASSNAFESNRTCADATLASNNCVSTVPCDELNETIARPFELSPDTRGNTAFSESPNIPADLTCVNEIRTAGEACFGLSFFPIFNEQSQIVEFGFTDPQPNNETENVSTEE